MPWQSLIPDDIPPQGTWFRRRTRRGRERERWSNGPDGRRFFAALEPLFDHPVLVAGKNALNVGHKFLILVVQAIHTGGCQDEFCMVMWAKKKRAVTRSGVTTWQTVYCMFRLIESFFEALRSRREIGL